MKKLLKIIFNKYIRIHQINTNHELISLGSEYGNWKFLKFKSLYNSKIISAGIGEDITFDIEFLNLFSGTVILIDPTPRAIDHMDKVFKSLGSAKSEEYTKGGSQNIASYDLRKITSENLVLYKKALWNQKNKSLKFYFPENKNFVSNTLLKKSLIGKNKNFMMIKTTDIKEIIKNESIIKLELIKLDIEGSEIRVISSMLKNNIFPNQILIELDYIKKNTNYSILKSLLLIRKIINSGYNLINIINYKNYLFVKKELINEEKF